MRTSLQKVVFLEKRSSFHRSRQIHRVMFDSNRESTSSDNNNENAKLQNFITLISKQSLYHTVSQESLRGAGAVVTQSDSFCKLNSRAFGDKPLRLQALRELFPDINDFPENIDALLILLKGTELFLSIGGDDRLTINSETQVLHTCTYKLAN